MSRPARVLALCVSLLLTACAAETGGVLPPPATSTAVSEAREAGYRPVILVSIDGFRVDYVTRGRTPTLGALAAEGATTPAMRPSFPSLTFPNHYTLVTGLRPDRHGIVNNTMQDPEIPGVTFTLSNRTAVEDPRWWDDGTPIWVTARRQGRVADTMFWPGSETEVHGVRPDEWRRYDGTVSADARVDTVLGWLDRPAGARPDFVTLYFDQLDHAGHDFGPDSPEVDRALGEVDGAVARLVAGLKARGLYDDADLVIVSDHGMAATAPDRVVWLEDVAPGARMVVGGSTAGLEALPGREAEVARLLLAPQPHMSCWRKDAIPARFHYGRHRRVPAFVCLAETGWTLTTREQAAKWKRFSPGQHGFDPYDPQMAALFVAHGPSFRRGVVLQPFDNVDVYPLLAKLLKVKPERNDGRLEDVAAALR
jgi:predicted AlkP superfamily pyrophosphatase or phosphodiesterase